MGDDAKIECSDDSTVGSVNRKVGSSFRGSPGSALFSAVADADGSERTMGTGSSGRAAESEVDGFVATAPKRALSR
jgi:hypothetical protein